MLPEVRVANRMGQLVHFAQAQPQSVTLIQQPERYSMLLSHSISEGLILKIFQQLERWCIPSVANNTVLKLLSPSITEDLIFKIFQPLQRYLVIKLLWQATEIAFTLIS